MDIATSDNALAQLIGFGNSPQTTNAANAVLPDANILKRANRHDV